MAEKYGTIPKKFTKEWWNYFWEYYKIHTISIIIVVIAITTTVYSKVTAPKYDLTVAYVGQTVIDDEKNEEIKKLLSSIAPDVNENGESLVNSNLLSFSLDDPTDEYAMGMHSKLQLSLAADDIYLYIIDESHLIAYAEDELKYCPFEPVEKWLEGDLKFKRYALEGTDIAISLAGNKYLEKLGIDSENKYLAMRYYPRDDQKSQLEGYKGAIELANAIIK